jgi:uncharacterized membrane protein YeaQ/YmgE (transglycosylase-associated protein family)
MHSYRVYPEGPGEKILSIMSVGVTWGMACWPLLRCVIGALLLLALLKVIRERI